MAEKDDKITVKHTQMMTLMKAHLLKDITREGGGISKVAIKRTYMERVRRKGENTTDRVKEE